MDDKVIIVKDGYTFNYSDGRCTGSIGNIALGESFEITIRKIGSQYHCSCMISGVYIQIWCTEYRIEKITY